MNAGGGTCYTPRRLGSVPQSPGSRQGGLGEAPVAGSPPGALTMTRPERELRARVHDQATDLAPPSRSTSAGGLRVHSPNSAPWGGGIGLCGEAGLDAGPSYPLLSGNQTVAGASQTGLGGPVTPVV